MPIIYIFFKNKKYANIEFETKFYATFAKEYMHNLLFMGYQFKVKATFLRINFLQIKYLTI